MGSSDEYLVSCNRSFYSLSTFSVVRGETKLIHSGGHYQWFLLLSIHFQRDFT